MNGFYSRAERVTGTVQIWAVPRSKWDADDAPPFTYEISKSYRSGAVMVSEQTITLEVPEGINLVECAMQTVTKEYNDEVDRLARQSLDALQDYNEKISQLRLLAGPSRDSGDIEGTAEVLGE